MPSLPDFVALCQATNGFCSDQTTFPVRTGSLTVDASKEMAVHIYDCKEAGLDGICDEQQREKEENGDEQVHTVVDLEAVRFLELELNPPQAALDAVGHILINTTHRRDPVSGRTVQSGGELVTEKIVGDGRPDPGAGAPGGDYFTAARSPDPCADGKIKRVNVRMGSPDNPGSISADRRFVVFDIEAGLDGNCKGLDGTGHGPSQRHERLRGLPEHVDRSGGRVLPVRQRPKRHLRQLHRRPVGV